MTRSVSSSELVTEIRKQAGPTWTCARCGAIEQSFDGAARHIAAMHSGKRLRMLSQVAANSSDPSSVMAVSALEATSQRQPAQSLSGDARLSLRLRVAVTRGRLDRQIAAGRPCEATPALALRARQLTEMDNRTELARELRGVVRSCPALSRTAIDRARLTAGREALLGLADGLDGSGPVSARGVALVQALLTDGVGSPLFNLWCEPTAVHAVWKVAHVLMAGPRQTAQSPAMAREFV
jgi:hypothetical protein